MKANKTHISLETAKLLKDCGVESENYFVCITEIDNIYKMSSNLTPFIRKGKIKEEELRKDEFITEKIEYYPAYTWQEILWENADKFFGDDECECDCCGWDDTGFRHEPQCSSLNEPGEYTKHILKLLQQKKYEEADKYFREHTILIN